ncbi:unnamed protein product [Symbiodinium pilosum]|uniref:Uncharacterized protein n=1 Tax=Symbiodinium pilosum TaxID=2952 RepID=A0A812ML09_SYMPI|nr:unnamed protein product [Symbiodinium pilosum]
MLTVAARSRAFMEVLREEHAMTSGRCTNPGAFLTPERRVSQPLETTPNPLSAPSRTTTFARGAADNSEALTQPGFEEKARDAGPRRGPKALDAKWRPESKARDANRPVVWELVH